LAGAHDGTYRRSVVSPRGCRASTRRCQARWRCGRVCGAWPVLFQPRSTTGFQRSIFGAARAGTFLGRGQGRGQRLGTSRRWTRKRLGQRPDAQAVAVMGSSIFVGASSFDLMAPHVRRGQAQVVDPRVGPADERFTSKVGQIVLSKLTQAEDVEDVQADGSRWAPCHVVPGGRGLGRPSGAESDDSPSSTRSPRSARQLSSGNNVGPLQAHPWSTVSPSVLGPERCNAQPSSSARAAHCPPRRRRAWGRAETIAGKGWACRPFSPCRFPH